MRTGFGYNIKMMKKYWMKVLLVVVLYCILELNCEDNHKHGNVGRNQIFEEIFEHLGTTATSHDNHTLITRGDLGKLLKDLYFRNCSNNEAAKNCHLCYDVSDLLKWQDIGAKENLTEEEFKELSPAVLYLLTPQEQKTPNSGVVCKTFIEANLNQSEGVFKKFQNKYGSTLNETSVESILDEINGTIGEHLTNKECFSVHDVIKGANVSEDNISDHDLEYVSGFIILKLLDKHCIKEEHHDDHDHDHNHNETNQNQLPKPSFFVDEIFEEFGNKTYMTHEHFEAFYKKIKLGKEAMSAATTEAPTTDSHAGHNHRKRRATDNHDHDHENEHDDHKKCFDAEQILNIYSVPEGSTINKAKFQEICPSLIQQIESGACNPKAAASNSSKTEEDEAWKPWVGMIISIFIISLASLSGILTKPISEKKWFPYLILGLIALAVSVLIGDAILHLLPHALDLHKHEEGGHDHSAEGNPLLEKDSYIWKSLLFLAGVYFFFMFEVFMHSYGAGHTHSHDPANNFTNNSNGKGKESTTIVNYNRRDSNAGLHKHDDTQIKMSVQSLPTSNDFNYAKNKEKKLSVKNFQSVAWMIVIGDAIHNFLDGVAIGVAFSETWPSGYHGGISTSIAIFCHELPHELGDFAVLLSTGLSIKQALLMNFFSSLTAFVGGIVGVALGTQWNASSWIFAITAGLFVYIALVDMLPELLHSPILKLKPAVCILIINIGMFIGFVIMFLLAAWEEDIKTALKDDKH